MKELGYFLNIDKSAGMTSRKVVDLVGRAARTKRVGHAGTLDPLATGVLIVAIERATRLVEFVQAQEKIYDAEFILGQSSDTDDIEGSITAHMVAHEPSRQDIERALTSFIGVIEQLPPQFSALKISGQPAYKLARKGLVVELKPRPVTIHSIELLGYEYPYVRLRIRCGSGTYIRSIARDLGQRLGTGGLMKTLRRVAIGAFHVDDAMKVDEISPEALLRYRLPLRHGVRSLPQITIDFEQSQRFFWGQAFHVSGGMAGENIAVFDEEGNLLGMATSSDGQTMHPVKGGFREFNKS